MDELKFAEFTAKDIVAIPIGSDGKFRVKRCKIVGEKDLKELGVEGHQCKRGTSFAPGSRALRGEGKSDHYAVSAPNRPTEELCTRWGAR